MLSWVENEHIEYGLKIRRVSYILLKEKFEVVNVKTDWPQSPTTFRFEGVIKTLPKYGKKNHTHWLHWLIRLNLNKLCDIDYLDSVWFIMSLLVEIIVSICLKMKREFIPLKSLTVINVNTKCKLYPFHMYH